MNKLIRRADSISGKGREGIRQLLLLSMFPLVNAFLWVVVLSLGIVLLFYGSQPLNCSNSPTPSPSAPSPSPSPSAPCPSPTPCPAVVTNDTTLTCTLNASDVLGTESSLCVDGNICTKDLLLSDNTCIHRSFPSTTACSTACNIDSATSGYCSDSTCTLSNPKECLGWCPYEMKVCDDTPANCVNKTGCPLLPIAPPIQLPQDSDIYNSTVFYTSACIFNSCRYLTVSDIAMWNGNYSTVSWVEETCDQLLNPDDNRTKETCFSVDTIHDTDLNTDYYPSGSTFCSYAYTCMLFNASSVPFTISAADAEPVSWGNLTLPIWMSTGHPEQDSMQVMAYSQMASILYYGTQN